MSRIFVCLGIFWMRRLPVDCARGRRRRECQPERGALARRADDVDVGAMALGDAVHHRQPEAGTAFALGGEEWLQAAAARGFVHAGAGVADLDEHAARDALAGLERMPRAQRERAALGHRVGRIEDEIDQRLAQLAGEGHDHRTLPVAFDFRLDDRAALLRHVAPARARQLEHFAQTPA